MVCCRRLMVRSEYPRATGSSRGQGPRSALGARGALLAALAIFGAGFAWSACSIDDRDPGYLTDASVGIGSNQGGSGGGGPGSVASVELTPSAIDLGPVVVGAPAR